MLTAHAGLVLFDEYMRAMGIAGLINHELPGAGSVAGYDPSAHVSPLVLMKKPRFALNPQSDAAHARLIVLDEVSMVGFFSRDLMSFGKPILVLGDPGQLPPIKGEGAFTKDAPDVMLTEIDRQAEESAIIRLATMARQGEPIGFGQYDTFVWKMRKMDVTPEQCLRGGQVICGLNATRLQLNNAMRRGAGFGDSWLPTGRGEKIICLKNSETTLDLSMACSSRSRTWWTRAASSSQRPSRTRKATKSVGREPRRPAPVPGRVRPGQGQEGSGRSPGDR